MDEIMWFKFLKFRLFELGEIYLYFDSFKMWFLYFFNYCMKLYLLYEYLSVFLYKFIWVNLVFSIIFCNEVWNVVLSVVIWLLDRFKNESFCMWDIKMLKVFKELNLI